MKLLSGLDASFLFLETPQMPMHVGAVHVLELPKGFRGRFVTRLRQHMAERLPLAPALRRRVWSMPLNLASPAWVDAEPDLDVHIVEILLPPAARHGDGMAEIEAEVGRLHPALLDRERPLWKFHVFEGLGRTADGRRRVGLYSKFHHAAVDGQAAVALGQLILDLSPEGRAIELRPSRREKVTRLGVGEMLRGAIAREAELVARIVRQLPSTIQTLGGAAGHMLRGAKAGAEVSNVTLAPRTALNHSIGTTRAFAGVSLPLPELRAIAHALDATLNDLVLQLCSTALRRWLAAHGGVPRKSLVAGVPITLRQKGDTRADNQASMSLVSLGTHIADFRRRFAHVKAATAAMKSTMGPLKGILPTDFPSIGVPWLVEALTALYGRAKVADRIPVVANVVISNVPGPEVPLYMAGARMRCNYPTSICVHGVALNITVQSFDAQMDFGLMADGEAMPDVRLLADALREAMDELRAFAAPPPASPAPRATGRRAAAR